MKDALKSVTSPPSTFPIPSGSLDEEVGNHSTMAHDDFTDITGFAVAPAIYERIR